MWSTQSPSSSGFRIVSSGGVELVALALFFRRRMKKSTKRETKITTPPPAAPAIGAIGGGCVEAEAGLVVLLERLLEGWRIATIF